VPLKCQHSTLSLSLSLLSLPPSLVCGWSAALERAGVLDPSLHLPFHPSQREPPWALYPTEARVDFAEPAAHAVTPPVEGALARASNEDGTTPRHRHALGHSSASRSDECPEVALRALRPVERRLGRLHCEWLGTLCDGGACYP
jgi:hypothetical protein